MPATESLELEGGLLSPLLSDEVFWPSEPRSLAETGIGESLVESLICKYLRITGTASGRNIAEQIGLPFGVLDPLFATLRARQIVVHAGSAPFNDYYYTLTENGRQQALNHAKACAYVGPAPVPLMDYVIATEAQAIRGEPVRREQLEAAFRDISVPPALVEVLGPAINSGAGMFVYGAPGNGKSTIAKRLTMCFGQEIWLPYAIVEDGHIVKVFDGSYHQEIKKNSHSLLKTRNYDRRWIKVRRPTVVVGGELKMDDLEIRHDSRGNISEAPLQMKSNCGCLLIDDFGRQRAAPAELLNRWIIPLEARHDFLTLPSGKKIQVPFEQIVIFSTNLEPQDLVDEAFLRRIPYKIEVADPDEAEFHHLFRLYADAFGIEYRRGTVQYLIDRCYKPHNRPLRRCHPRDILSQIRNYCAYHDLPLEMRNEHFDRVAYTYFTLVMPSRTVPNRPAQVAGGPTANVGWKAVVAAAGKA